METKIAIIEDDSTMRQLLQTLLSIEGFTVVALSVTTIEQVLNELVIHQPGAVLSDIHLKNMNGLDIVRAIRRKNDIQQPAIVVVSGMDLAAESSDAGANSFFLKPYMPDLLIKWFREHLKQ